MGSQIQHWLLHCRAMAAKRPPAPPRVRKDGRAMFKNKIATCNGEAQPTYGAAAARPATSLEL
jgi:hypothetical protein